MAITSIGYDGTMTEADWAQLIPLVGSSHYGVAEKGDWEVTTHPTLARGVSISTGSGWGNGVLDTSDTTVSLQGGTITSGSRWDMVVARRDWSGPSGTTSFAVISGSSSKRLPGRNDDPGVLDDQPLALVQFTAGKTAPTQIVDLRCWSRNGGVLARDVLALDYLKHAGARVMIGTRTWARGLDSNGNLFWTVPEMRATGKIMISIVPSQNEVTIPVELPSGFTLIPNIQATMSSNVGYPASKLKVAVWGETKELFKLKLYTDDYKPLGGVGYNITVNWLATQ